MLLLCARFTRARAMLPLKVISKSFQLRFLVMFANQEPITWSIGHMCCTLESTHSRKELFTEQAFPREWCVSQDVHILSISLFLLCFIRSHFTTKESWLPVIKKLTKVNPRTHKGVGGRGDVMWVDATSLRFIGVFFLEDKTPAPDVFSSCLFILRANFETSSVMVICYRYDIRRQE